MTAARKNGKRGTARRIGAVAWRLAAGGLALVVVVALLPLLPPVRGWMLGDALRRADRALPGRLAAGGAVWPSPGRIRLERVLWTAEEDTLVSADLVEVDVALGGLLHRDLVVRRLEFGGVRADVPAIVACVAKGKKEEAKRGGIPWFREGAFPGWPSAVIGEVRVTAPRVVVAPGRVVEAVDFTFAANLTAGGEAWAELDHLSASDGAGEWSIEITGVRVDPAAGAATGSIRGRFAPVGDFKATLDPLGPDSLRFDVVLDALGEAPALETRLRLLREEGRLIGTAVDASVRVPAADELRRIPALAGKLGALPDLEGTTMSARGDIRFAPFRWEGAARFEPNWWLDGGCVAARGGARAVVVDSLHLRMAGLGASATARTTPDSIDASATVRVDGLEWLARLGKPVEGIDSVAARADFVFAGPKGNADLGVRIAGGARRGGLRIDRFDVNARLAADPAAPSPFDIALHAMDLGLFLTGDWTRGDTIAIRLDPVVLAESAPARPGGPSGAIRFVPGDGSVAVRALRVAGDAGDVLLGGRRSPSGDVDFDLEWKAPRLPPLLLRAKSIPANAVDSLRSRWRADGPFFARAKGGVEPRPAGTRITWNGACRLPGPSTLAPLLPAGARVEDLVPLEGRTSGEWVLGAAAATFDVRAGFDPNRWVDEFRAVVRGGGGSVAVDTAVVVLAEGIALRGGGVFADSSWNGWIAADMDSAPFLARFLGDGGSAWGAALHADVTIGGDAASPEIGATWDGRFVAPGFDAGAVRGRAERLRRGWAVEVDAQESGRLGPVAFDRLAARFRSTAPDSGLFPADTRIAVSGPGYEVVQRARLGDAGGWEARVESLAVRLRGRSAATHRPFRARYDPATRSLAVDTLRMSGELGSVAAQGELGPERTDLFVEIGLDLPEKPDGLAIPPGLWPRRLDASVHAPDASSLVAEIGVQGVVWSGRVVDVDVGLDGHGGEGTARLTVAEKGRTRLDVDARAPMEIGLAPLRLGVLDGPVDIRLRADAFPVALAAGTDESPAHVFTVDGTAAVRGTAAKPTGTADLVVTAPAPPGADSLHVDLHVSIGESTGPRLTEGTLSARVASDVWLRGDFSWPTDFSLTPALFRLRREGPVSAHAASDELPLDQLGGAVSMDFGLEGKARVRFAATGDAADPALEGEASANGMKVTLADGSWVAADAKVAFSGSALRPGLEGEIDVPSGVLRVPEKSRTLLPAEGDAILWEGAGGDTSGAAEVRDDERAAPAARPLDLDVTVSIPSGVWIRGQGLEVELSGELRLIQKGAFPTVTGELNAISGRFLFLGHTFTVDRGRVVFYGDDESNPSLDLQLSSNVQGTEVRVLFQGTAKEPELTLQSDPSMPEGDILSFLVFGRPVDELNNDQTGLLQRRATEVATTFGMAEIESHLAKQLGVDLLTIQKFRGGGKGNSLLVGKYITRKVLLKYEQALEDRQSFYINLEYFLTRHFKVETLFGHQNQSGAELNWSVDY